MTTTSENFYDCIISYHLFTGHTVSESFRKDIPQKLWAEIKEKFDIAEESLEIYPSDTYAQMLLPKSNIAYITLKISPHA